MIITINMMVIIIVIALVIISTSGIWWTAGSRVDYNSAESRAPPIRTNSI